MVTQLTAEAVKQPKEDLAHSLPGPLWQGTTTWTGHKEWCRRRRAKAAVWLMRRGLKAKQLIRVRAATHLILLQVRA